MKDGKFLSMSDLARRWGVARQTVNGRRDRHPDFPEPTFRIGQNRAPVFYIDNVEKYEKAHGFKPKKGADDHE